MRRAWLCGFAGLLTLTGCAKYEAAPASVAEPKAAEQDCPTGDCCSVKSRAALLKKSQEAAPESPDESK